MTTQDIDRRIETLEHELGHLGPYPTEVYTRIVGYYRSLANWNAGKREEYGHRREYEEDGGAALSQPQPQPQPQSAQGKAAGFLLFTQPGCPHCPAMKAKAAALPVDGREIDAGTREGYEAAARWSVTSTPTLILLDGQDAELKRVMSAGDWPALEPWL